MIFAQETMTGEIIVDNFAGGGGASTGIEIATGMAVAIAINHDPAAILMHKTNHPYTEHFQASVWDIDPVAVCRGRSVGLAWFSPDCKHFSKAKGAALVDRKIRGLAWITLRWAAKVRPRVIILENVEEFQTWGPVRKGKPVKKLAGTTFRKFIDQLTELGYTVEYRELIAADYGAPTSRKRFYLVARCDGKPIVWPKPTHSKTGADGLPKWRSAAEIIDWSLPCPSVFATKTEIMERYGLKAVRPLAKNTMRRIIRGVDKFTIRSGKPFIVPTGYGERKGQAPRVHDIDAPVPTVVSTGKENLCKPLLAPVTVTNTSNSVGATVGEPVHTVTTAGNQMLVTPSLVSIGQTGGGDRIRDIREPVPTTVSKQEACLVAPALIQYHTEQTEHVRASGLGAPINTVDASNRYGLTCANLVEYYTGGRPLDVQDPMHTVTSHDREAVVAAHIAKYYGGVVGEKVGEPLPTVTAIDHNAVCAAHVVKFKGDNVGTPLSEPLQTVTASAGKERACSGGTFAVCKAYLAKMRSGDDLGHWPEIRALLNEFCGYALADDDVLLLEIGGGLYYIADIGLRMLSPRELYNAMGFPPDYIIDRDYESHEYKKSAQVARCGNAVCPPVASALVRANLPEWCGVTITTMAQLMDCVAV
jgi:DNA (cytosine-5)-methyltransferase 1|nr:MAG TPA: DNA cytosine methyltransferase [Caudoviricetes sp.]